MAIASGDPVCVFRTFPAGAHKVLLVSPKVSSQLLRSAILCESFDRFQVRSVFYVLLLAFCNRSKCI